ncbi:hypothetical protein KY339_00840 [Candidatus Woesearchaeota archaeon]|nr:hypothetical protein [Candidatus Woesearchaeota archaeon]
MAIKEISLHYKPLEIGEEGQLTNGDYKKYIHASGLNSLIANMVIKPFEEALKRSRRKEFDFEQFRVRKSAPKKGSTEWKKVFEKLKAYIDIRADDSRNQKIKGLKRFDGVGYCVSLNSVLSEIEKYVGEHTKPPSSPGLSWPPIRKGEELPHRILIPERDYSEITTESGIIVLKAKRFKSGLEKRVLGEYKKANGLWLKNETGFDRENIPKKKESPVTRIREVCPGVYVLVQMVREDKPNYRNAVTTMKEELGKLAEGEDGKLKGLYKVKEFTKGMLYVNIKRLGERLEKLLKPKADVRYTIIP